jgi:ribonuclease HI
MIEIYFDGACEPVNPGGTASYGWVIKKNGKIILEEGKIIGSGKGMTNNVAEYTALIGALKTLRDSEIKTDMVKIYGDSNLVCNTVTKKWGWNSKKTKWVPHKDVPHLRVLLEETLDILKNYKYEIKWIPASDNHEADYLSRRVLVDAGIINSEVERCSKCLSKLVIRQGPHSKFYGCSKYPRCKFTKKIE